MNPLYIDDIILVICSHLDDYSKIQWLSVCKQYRALIDRTTIFMQVHYTFVARLSYRKIFSNLLINTLDYPNVLMTIKDFEKLQKIIFIEERMVVPWDEDTLCRYKYEYELPVIWPPNIRFIRFGEYFNQSINLPPSLRIVKFGYYYDHPTILPDGLEIVKFAGIYNQSTKLPDSIQYAAFGYKFNQQIELPPGIRCVEFGARFNQPMTLPNRLNRAIFGSQFNQPVILPDSIQSATFGYKFNQTLNFPKSLQTLNVSENYMHSVPGHIAVFRE